MDFKRLRTFKAAAQFLNFSEASSHLGYVQSAVTTQIQALEEELATVLFKRTGRGVALTQAGEKLLEYCDKLFSLRSEAINSIQGIQDDAGILRIAGYETILTYRLPAIIHQFNQQFPNARLHIQPIGVKQLRQLVISEQVDLALIFDEALDNQKQTIPGLEQLNCQQEEVVIIASKHHPIAQKTEIFPWDLANQTLLLTEQGCYYRNRFERALIQAGALTGNIMEFTSIEAIKACVKLGTGIAAISKISVTKELNTGELVALPWQGDNLGVNLQLIWKSNIAKGNTPGPLAQAFIKMCQTQFA